MPAFSLCSLHLSPFHFTSLLLFFSTRTALIKADRCNCRWWSSYTEPLRLKYCSQQKALWCSRCLSSGPEQAAYMQESVITHPSALLIWSLMALERSFTTTDDAAFPGDAAPAQLCKQGYKICRPCPFLLPLPLAFHLPESRWPLPGRAMPKCTDLGNRMWQPDSCCFLDCGARICQNVPHIWEREPADRQFHFHSAEAGRLACFVLNVRRWRAAIERHRLSWIYSCVRPVDGFRAPWVAPRGLWPFLPAMRHLHCDAPAGPLDAARRVVTLRRSDGGQHSRNMRSECGLGELQPWPQFIQTVSLRHHI